MKVLRTYTLVLLLCALAIFQMGIVEVFAQSTSNFAAVTHARKAYINTRNKISREEGFISVGATVAEAEANSIKECRKKTLDYNGKQRCAENVLAGPISNYFVVAVCSLEGISGSSLGTGKTLKSAFANAKANAAKRYSSFSVVSKRMSEGEVRKAVVCREMRNFLNGKRI